MWNNARSAKWKWPLSQNSQCVIEWFHSRPLMKQLKKHFTQCLGCPVIQTYNSVYLGLRNPGTIRQRTQKKVIYMTSSAPIIHDMTHSTVNIFPSLNRETLRNAMSPEHPTPTQLLHRFAGIEHISVDKCKGERLGTSNIAISARASSRSQPSCACVTPAWHRISLPEGIVGIGLITYTLVRDCDRTKLPVMMYLLDQEIT